MDSSHKLDAPNNEDLRLIEQIDDHSGMSSIYREAHVEYEGEILSAEEREKAKEAKAAAYTSGLWKSFITVGIYVPYPFISGLLLGVGLNMVAGTVNPFVFAILIALAGGLWAYTSYVVYAKIYKIFYKHALRANPFLFVMLVSILLASQAIYTFVTIHLAGESLLFNISLVSLFVVIYSLIASLIIMLVWGSTNVKSGFKALASALVLIVSGFLAIYSFMV